MQKLKKIPEQNYKIIFKRMKYLKVRKKTLKKTVYPRFLKDVFICAF